MDLLLDVSPGAFGSVKYTIAFALILSIVFPAVGFYLDYKAKKKRRSKKAANK